MGNATPATQDEILSALGLSPRRIEIVAYVGSSTIGRSADELMAELGLSRSGLNEHIRPLVAAGLLTPVPDPQDAERRSGKLLWRVDVDAVERYLKDLRNALGR
jgi:DNA-binding MarR family transcriptional regulator